MINTQNKRQNELAKILFPYYWVLNQKNMDEDRLLP